MNNNTPKTRTLNLGNLPRIATLNTQLTSLPPMTVTHQLKYSNNLFELNGYFLTDEDMELFLGISGFYVFKLTRLNWFVAVMKSLLEIPDFQINNELKRFATYTPQEKLEIRILIDKHREIVENPRNN